MRTRTLIAAGVLLLVTALPALAADPPGDLATNLRILTGAEANRHVADALHAGGPAVSEFNRQGFRMNREGTLVAEYQGEIGILIPFISNAEPNRAGMIRCHIVNGQISGGAGWLTSDPTTNQLAAGASVQTFGSAGACSWSSW